VRDEVEDALQPVRDCEAFRPKIAYLEGVQVGTRLNGLFCHDSDSLSFLGRNLFHSFTHLGGWN